MKLAIFLDIETMAGFNFFHVGLKQQTKNKRAYWRKTDKQLEKNLES